ncbi:SMI1/KNR4 family protein [Pseudomonas folii]|uniref:SMI1/KNR4 family protein n=1 Tax=Pseudomonas folii TaxID=2762593 RepID=A0ABR7AY57_9PSED|nr:SMI1/KNR4 family protein [Pseudomonas folii]MBC3949866.1 SMI1/KNR4 family protein [Pseudomonas folii]
MNYLDVIESEINASGEELISAGSADDSLILTFEKEMGVVFPLSYKLFLKRFGALSFAGDTYYGITKSGLAADSIPSVMFATMSARSQGDADSKMIVIQSSGYGPIYSIDTSISSGPNEHPIIETELSFKREASKLIIFESYEDFFLSTVRNAIKEL